MAIPAEVASAWSASVDSPAGSRQRLQDPRHAAAKARFRVVGPVIEPDPAGASEHFAERPVADAAIGREAAALEDRCGRCPFPCLGEELAHQAALADAGRAVDKDESRSIVHERVVERTEQLVELHGTPDERRLERAVAWGGWTGRGPDGCHPAAESNRWPSSVDLAVRALRGGRASGRRRVSPHRPYGEAAGDPDGAESTASSGRSWTVARISLK